MIENQTKITFNFGHLMQFLLFVIISSLCDYTILSHEKHKKSFRDNRIRSEPAEEVKDRIFNK
jgi:hypothetical protein